MATDWSEAAKAKRSASAKKAAETRKRKQAEIVKAEARLALGWPDYAIHSRVARWALSNVSVLAMMRGARHVRWGRRTELMLNPY